MDEYGKLNLVWFSIHFQTKFLMIFYQMETISHGANVEWLTLLSNNQLLVIQMHSLQGGNL